MKKNIQRRDRRRSKHTHRQSSATVLLKPIIEDVSAAKTSPLAMRTGMMSANKFLDLCWEQRPGDDHFSVLEDSYYADDPPEVILTDAELAIIESGSYVGSRMRSLQAKSAT